MTLRDCTCRDCLCYRGTRDRSSLCAACQKARHPGDPRPAGWFLRAAENPASLPDRLPIDETTDSGLEHGSDRGRRSGRRTSLSRSPGATAATRPALVSVTHIR